MKTVHDVIRNPYVSMLYQKRKYVKLFTVQFPHSLRNMLSWTPLLFPSVKSLPYNVKKREIPKYLRSILKDIKKV